MCYTGSYQWPESPALAMVPRHLLWKSRVVIQSGIRWGRRCHGFLATADRNPLSVPKKGGNLLGHWSVLREPRLREVLELEC